MKFGKVIRLEAGLTWNEKWHDHYLDYKSLKQLLLRHAVGTRVSGGSVGGAGGVKTHARLDAAAAASFWAELRPWWKREVLKLDTFIRRESDELAKRVEDFSSGLGAASAAPGGAAAVHEQLLTLQMRHKRLAQFLAINFEGQSKFLKKVDKALGLGDEYVAEASALAQAPAEHLDVAALRGAAEERRARHAAALHAVRDKLEHVVGQSSKPLKFDTEAAEDLFHASEVEEHVPVVRELVLDSLAPSKVTRIKLAISVDEMGEWISVPVLIAKGRFAGPVLGITSALHGNELNGIPLIFRLFREIDVESMYGTLVAVPVLNPPGYRRRQRGFSDGADLNRLFPGKPDGNCGQVFVHNVMHKLIRHFEYHIDLHTASFGRVNSLYVRANMLNALTHTMAMLQHPQIIVHNTAPDGSLRSAAMALNIPSITVEIGDPLQFHNEYVVRSLHGVEKVMKWLNMQRFDDDSEEDGGAGGFARGAGKVSLSGSLSGSLLRPRLPSGDATAQQGDAANVVLRSPKGGVLGQRRPSLDSFVGAKSVDGNDSATEGPGTGGVRLLSPSSESVISASELALQQTNKLAALQRHRDSLVAPPLEHTTVCARSKWIYSQHGGVLRVKPDVNTWVQKNEVIAIIQDLFGNIVKTYRAPADAIVVGKSNNPICQTGDRIVHIGFVEAEFVSHSLDGHE